MSPFPFGRICFVVLVMRKGGDCSWSGPWHLVYTLEVFHVHSYQDQFIQPCWAECFFCVISLGLCFVCSFVLFALFVCPHSFYVSLSSWVISLTVFGGTGISGLMIGLATLPQGGSRSLQWSETGMEDPQQDPWQCTANVCVVEVHCWEILG